MVLRLTGFAAQLYLPGSRCKGAARMPVSRTAVSGCHRGCDDPRMRLGAISSAASEDEVAAVAQLVECVLGKDEVTGSIPVSSFWE